MSDQEIIRKWLDQHRHPTYGTLLELIEEIRQDHERGIGPRMGQVGALFQTAAELEKSLMQGEAEQVKS